jgi:CubicO group peptidase (beta-lactamase class C family)
VTDVTGKPFAAVMRERVLGPIAMTHSTYEQFLPEFRWLEAATGYRPTGEPVEERWHVYPEQAAAGLWTTPADLARWGLAVLAAYNGVPGGVLTPAMARQMLTGGMGNYGLGPGVSADGKSFGHGGANEGFRCQITVFFDGRGAVVMTNSDVGGLLIREVLGTLAAAYGWPAFRPAERTVVALPAATLAEITGTYRFPGDNSDGVISLDGSRLFLSHRAVGRVELLPESEQTLFSRDDGGRITVVRENGRVVAILAFGRRAERQKD